MEDRRSLAESAAKKQALARLVGKAVWAILVRKGLTEPEVLRGMSDKDLLAVKGIGPRRLRTIREALKRLVSVHHSGH